MKNMGAFAAIRDLDALKGRCRVDELTGCWTWVGATNRGTEPRIWVPPPVPAGLSSSTTAARYAYYLLNGGDLTGKWVWRTCSNPMCVNPVHLKAGTRAKMGEWQQRTGSMKADARRSAINSLNSAKQALPSETVATVLEMLEEGRKLRDIARSTGINYCTVSKIKNGQHISQRQGVANVSVFTWRP